MIEGKSLSTTVGVEIGFFDKEEAELRPVLRRDDAAFYQAIEGGSKGATATRTVWPPQGRC